MTLFSKATPDTYAASAPRSDTIETYAELAEAATDIKFSAETIYRGQLLRPDSAPSPLALSTARAAAKRVLAALDAFEAQP